MPLEVTEEIQWYLDRHLSHQIHTSERRAWRSCRRRWDWVYRDMYYPQTTPEPLEFGVAFHEAMEVFYEPRTWSSDLEIRTSLALVAFRRKCEAQLKAYKKLNADPDVMILESYKERLNLGLNMIRYYCNHMTPHYDKNWTPVRVEVSFEVPLDDPDTGTQMWCKCDPCWRRWLKAVNTNKVEDPKDQDMSREEWIGLPVTYGGRLDALFKDEIARYWIADWKTTIRLLDEDAEASFLQLDDQISSYLWALHRYGIECAGFVYVEIKKTFPQEPEKLKRKYQGKMYSTSKQFMTTYEIALRTFQREDPDAWQMGLYDPYLRWLQTDGPMFTQRNKIHKNTAEIENVGLAIAHEAKDMINNPRVYPMPGRFSCNWCMFKQPCLGKNMGEDYMYTLSTMFEKQELHYWEIKELSTD